MATVVNGNSAIVAVGHWLEEAFGCQVGEHPAFGGVSLVHTGKPPGGDPGMFWSNQERARNGASRHYAAAAIDVNHDDGNESEVLNEIYDLLAAHASEYGIDELFYQDRGIPTPVPDHWDHMHIGVDGEPSPALIDLIAHHTGGGGGFSLGDLLKPNAPGTPGGSMDQLNLPGAGDVASKLAREIVTAILNALGEDGARILLYIALVAGGATLVYYGAAKAAGVQKPIGAAAGVGVMAATKKPK